MNAYSITRESANEDAAALRYALEFASVKHSTHATALRALADSIEEQVKPAVEEPTEFGSVILATNHLGDRKRWLQTEADPTFLSPWLSERDMEWRRFGDLTDVEVLRTGVGPEPLAEWESDHLNFQYRRDVAADVLRAMDVDQYLIDAVVNATQTDEGAGALPDPLSPGSGVATSPPAPSSQDHVSLAVVLRVLDGVRDASITATEKEAVQRCVRSCMQLATYVGCWP